MPVSVSFMSLSMLIGFLRPLQGAAVHSTRLVVLPEEPGDGGNPIPAVRRSG
ncbi:hypothetical protein GMLC_12790 [Geomonas limicola]|uniref:Uncharacterized protein n=1 Tax=Geomonas limicola TaxID=2740186 RepID=A0A6V8N5N2_9BACT|nr:hypothetical protein GMLC_12790 [Geomonas limicola]